MREVQGPSTIPAPEMFTRQNQRAGEKSQLVKYLLGKREDPGSDPQCLLRSQAWWSFSITLVLVGKGDRGRQLPELTDQLVGELWE